MAMNPDTTAKICDRLDRHGKMIQRLQKLFAAEAKLLADVNRRLVDLEKALAEARNAAKGDAPRIITSLDS